jgi:MFS family permease
MAPTRAHAHLLNLAHLLDHFFLLIFPTAMLAISQEWQLSFSQLLPLSLPAMAIFGLGALPAGWLADRWSRRGMMAVFFFGIGAASVLAGLSQNAWQLGTTLALDFPNGGAPTLKLFDRLNAIVLDAGGRLYPAKDACMPRELFEHGYPRLGEFLRYRDPGLSSAMSRRLLGS